MAVTYFRPRRPGPELAIEDAVASRICDLFQNYDYPLWTAGSLPIGAGMPDLIGVSCVPWVSDLARVETVNAQILAYLRRVNRARLDTITRRMGRPCGLIVRCMNGLLDIKAVLRESNVYSLSGEWRNILPEIITIEAKVTNWQKAVGQAGRNRIFSHRSFIAVPKHVAERIRLEPVFGQLGIGLLSVDKNHEVSIIRPARCHRPRVWTYYYQLAFVIARHSKGVGNAIRSAVTEG